MQKTFRRCLYLPGAGTRRNRTKSGNVLYAYLEKWTEWSFLHGKVRRKITTILLRGGMYSAMKWTTPLRYRDRIYCTPNPASQRQTLPLLQKLLSTTIILGFQQNSK